VYKESKAFPSDEKFGLTSQLRRATASVPANIAEGCGRGTDAELRRFLEIAMGSASEVEYHLLLARDLGYMAQQQYAELEASTSEVKRMLAGFIKKLRSDQQSAISKKRAK
jgi:four helix bundle protein